MPRNPDAIPVAAEGDVYTAVFTDSLVLPTDSTTAPDAAFTKRGYISEDGVAFGISTDTEGIPAWQSRQAVRKVVTGQDIMVSFAMLEWDADTLPVAFGGGTFTDNGDGTWDFVPPTPSERKDFAVIIDALDGDMSYRIVFPRCSLEDLDDIEFAAGSPSQLAVELEALADSAGRPFYVYGADAGWTP